MTGAPLIPEIADSVLDWCEAPKRRLRALSGPRWFPADICCDARMCAQKFAGEQTGAGFRQWVERRSSFRTKAEIR
jgi:hypothetical protein